MTQDNITGDHVAERVRVAAPELTTEPLTVDGFEDGDTSEYVVGLGDGSEFTVQATTVYSGSNALQYTESTGSASTIASDSGLPRYPEPGNTWEMRVRTESDDWETNLMWAVQDPLNPYQNAYDLTVTGSGGGGSKQFQIVKRENGSGSTLAESGAILTIPTNEWLRFEVDWRENGAIIATLEDAAGNVIEELSTTDQTFNSGGIAWMGHFRSTTGNSIYYDQHQVIDVGDFSGGLTVGDSSPVKSMLANSVREGKPLSDDGRLYSTIQGAVDTAASFVFVPPGKFKSSVTISKPGLTLLGSGQATEISVDGVDAIEIRADNVDVGNMSIEVTDSGNTGTWSGVLVPDGFGVVNTNIFDIYFPTADHFGVQTYGERTTISNCTVNTSPNGNGYSIRGVGMHEVISCKSLNTDGFDGIYVGTDDNIIANCVIIDSGGGSGVDNIQVSGNDNIIIGNRTFNPINAGVNVTSGSTDNIVANNRSDSIVDNGTTTTLDANLTGLSN